jgi:hypothetical protein
MFLKYAIDEEIMIIIIIKMIKIIIKNNNFINIIFSLKTL